MNIVELVTVFIDYSRNTLQFMEKSRDKRSFKTRFLQVDLV